MFAARQLPNAITVLRIVLVLPTAWLLWLAEYRAALVLMAIAGASDGVDGWLARRFRWGSRFGEAMDPVADKLLIVVLFVVFTVQGHFPIWLAAIVVARDAAIVLGAAAYRLLFATIEFAPTYVSKANTALQISTLLLLLVSLCDLGTVSDLAAVAVDPYCFYIVAVLSVSSGLDYIVTWGLRAWRNSRRAH